jgi:hypothetical protein
VAVAALDATPPDDPTVETIRTALESGDWDDPAPC